MAGALPRRGRLGRIGAITTIELPMAFIEAAAWQGPREGYAFKSGDLGLGYYAQQGDREYTFEAGTVTFTIETPCAQIYARTWPAGRLLARALCEGFPILPDVCKKRACEVGTGTGLVSIAALHCGAASVLATDLPEAMRLVQRNLNRVSSSTTGKIAAQPLIWGHPIAEMGPFDVLLLADCTYDRPLLEPLCTSLSSLAGAEGCTLILAHSCVHSVSPSEVFDMLAGIGCRLQRSEQFQQEGVDVLVAIFKIPPRRDTRGVHS